MKFFEEWVELDLNPIITFSSSSKVLYSNSEAQFLLSKISPKELFDIALKYASKTYGAKTSYVNLHLLDYTFYAISVIYENDEQIHIKLYKSVLAKKNSTIDIKNTQKNNIFTLVDLSISANKIKTNIKFIKKYDPSIPEFNLEAKAIIKTLTSIFEAFSNGSEIICSVGLKIGEYMKIDNKKYSLVSIQIKSNKKSDNLDIKEFDSLVLSCIDEQTICIDLPLIL